MSTRGFSVAIQQNLKFVTEECISCGVIFAISDSFKEERLKDHRLFYCPNGHGQHFTSLSEAERLQKELVAAKQEKAKITEQLWEEQRKVREEQARSTQLAQRAARGVCPCCHRSFASTRMARHMKTKHPDFMK